MTTLLLAGTGMMLAACGSERATQGGPETTGSIAPLPAAPTGRITSAPLAAPPGGAPPPSIAAPRVTGPGVALAAPDLAGRWTLTGADGRRCGLSFTGGAGGPGTIALENGCPAPFYASRSVMLGPNGTLVIRDQNGAPVAQLAQAGPGRYQGRGPDGQTVTLER